jgi:hypothetical protein
VSRRWPRGLLQLNHERYAEEVRQGRHAKKKGKSKRLRNVAQRPPLGGPIQCEIPLF